MILCVYIGREIEDKIKNDFLNPAVELFSFEYCIWISRFSGNYVIVDLLKNSISDFKKLTRISLIK